MSQAKKISRFMLVAMALALIGISSLAEAQPHYYPKDYNKIIEASRAEKGLLIYSAMATDNWKPILAAFHKYYPWIEVKTLDMGGELFQRHIAESESGIATADFIATLQPTGWARFFEEKRGLRYPSPEIPYLPKWGTRQETVYSFSADPAIMVWNTKVMPAEMVPKGIADLAEKIQKRPDFFRGKLTSYGDTSTFGMFGTWGLSRHHGEKFWTWLDIIGPVTRPEQTGGAQLEKLLSGEYMMSFSTSIITLATSAVRKAGKLLGWKYMEDGNIVLQRGMAIPHKTPNVNSAKLMLDFILSQEGQVAMTKGNFTAYRADAAEKIPESHLHLERLMKLIGEKNVVLVGWDPEYGDEGKYKAIRERWRQAYFGKK
jgi:iron(III) transport system substrate-binding protein